MKSDVSYECYYVSGTSPTTTSTATGSTNSGDETATRIPEEMNAKSTTALIPNQRYVIYRNRRKRV